MLDRNVVARLVGQPSRRRDDIEKAAITNRRIGTRTSHLSKHRDSLRCRFIYENGDVRTVDKAPILKSLFDQHLCFVSGQPRDMNIVNQWEVYVSGPTNAGLRQEVRHSEHTDFDEIADAQFYIGIRQ